MDASNNEPIRLRMRYPERGGDAAAMHECPRCGGDGVNRTSRHLNRNGDDAASDFHFVPCWLCVGLGWLHPYHHSTNVAATEARRLEEELASAFPQHFKPRPPRKPYPMVVVQLPDATIKARLI